MQASPVVLWVDVDIDGFRRKVDTASSKSTNAREKIILQVASNANDALTLLKYDTPEIDAIVMDLYFDDQDSTETGINLFNTIREMDPDIPIIVLTDRAGNNEFFEAGAAHVKIRTDKAKCLATEKEIQSLFKEINQYVKQDPSYDRKQRMLANEVAGEYEGMETNRPGTIAYWLFEEEIISQLVQRKELDKASPLVNVIDIGCGTGRYGRVITETSESARVTCVDFSGKMLAEAQKTLSDDRCKFQRGLAEKLPKDFVNFDLAIMGFGFPSYSPTQPVLREARRILANDGWLFASVYNHAALAYDEWRGEDGDTQRPISTWIDRDSGSITIPASLGNTTLATRTFTISHFARELRQAGFQVGGYLTFPVLYSTLRCSDIENFSRVEKSINNGQEVDKYPHKGFSQELWRIDKKISLSLKDKGFYTVFLAARNKADIEDVARKLGFHVADTLKP